jgi:hypothetical protein
MSIAIRLAAPLAAVGLIAAIAVPGGSAQTPTGTTLNVVEKNGGTTTIVDNSPHSKGGRPAAGDQIVFSSPLYDASGAKRQGSLTAVCTIWRTTKGGEPPMICEGVYALPGGDLIVSGRLTPGVQHLAITGGTGAYAGAQGTVDSTPTNDGYADTIKLV